MVFTFGSQDTFKHCPTPSCGIGVIRHHIAYAEENGKKWKATLCCRCKRLSVEEQ